MDQEGEITQFVNDNQFRLVTKTVKRYRYTIRQLLEYTGKSLQDITKSDIRSWLIYLKEMGYKPRTLCSKLTVLRTFFNYCVEEGLTHKNPTVQIAFPRVGENLPYYLSMEQVTRIRRLLEGQLQERAILEVLYATGIRISELCAMQKEHIDWSERTIHIHNGKGKKDRIVLFTPQCGEHLKVYLESRTDDLPYVFLSLKFKDRAIHPNTVGQCLFKKYAKSLGFKVTPHTLRYTFAAHLAQKGMPLDCIQVLLGHVTPHLTRYYARLYNQARKDKYDEFM